MSTLVGLRPPGKSVGITFMSEIKDYTYSYGELQRANNNTLKQWLRIVLRNAKAVHWEDENSFEKMIGYQVAKWQLLLWIEFRVYIHRSRRLFRRYKWGEYITEMQKEYMKHV